MTDVSNKILVVDDDDSGRYVKSHILRRQGFTVLEAANGSTALRLIGAHRPAVVVLDMRLPDMSGLEVCRAIKESHPGVLVIQTSAALTGKKDRMAGLAGGADSYLVEPIEPEELTTTVQALMRLRKAERELRHMNDTLEHKVAERTRQLAELNGRLITEMNEHAKVQEIVRHTQKLDVLGQLTGGIAHDFNNLLMIILGNLETVKRYLEPLPQKPARLSRAVENATHGAQRAAKLTQGLLAFARKQSLDPKIISANHLVTAMSDLLRRTLGEQIRVSVALDDNLWPMHVDQGELENAVLNLAVNARDAMPSGGELRIETRNARMDETPDVPAGEYVNIVVTDTGKGMSEDVAAHAFEPFFTTKDIGHGTGLGLAQVYGFVTQSGGRVVLESRAGEGTTVRLYLPRFTGDGYAVVNTDEHSDRAVVGGSETILVVEDDDDVRAHTSGVLGELGYRVLQTTNGEAALRILAETPDIALLFTDIGLPGGLNGRQLGAEAGRRHPDLKVLYTTGYGIDALGEVRPNECVQIVRKPFTYAQLAEKVREVLGPEAPKPRILLVEDEELLRAAVVEALEDQGFQVEEAQTAEEAISKASLPGHRIDAAVVDFGLPDRKGDILAADLRAIDAKMPIIVVSGYSEERMRARVRSDHRIGFLSKPYGTDRLASMLARMGVRRTPKSSSIAP